MLRAAGVARVAVAASGAVARADVAAGAIAITVTVALALAGCTGVPRSAPTTIAALAARSSTAPSNRSPIRQVIVVILTSTHTASTAYRHHGTRCGPVQQSSGLGGARRPPTPRREQADHTRRSPRLRVTAREGYRPACPTRRSGRSPPGRSRGPPAAIPEKRCPLCSARASAISAIARAIRPFPASNGWIVTNQKWAKAARMTGSASGLPSNQ